MKLPIAFVGWMILIGGLALTVVHARASVPSFALEKNDVVVFMGGTNLLHLQQSGYLESILTQAFAVEQPRFRDLSWEADTVFRLGTEIERWRRDGFGTKDEQLKRTGGTVVVAQFGQLESMEGETGLEGFSIKYREFIDRLQKHTRLVVLVTPPPFERPASPLVPDLSRHNAHLAGYVAEIEKIAQERGLLFVDLFSRALPELTDNGMHIRTEAQSRVSQEIARQLGLPAPNIADVEPLRKAVIEKHRLWYDYWRPANWKLLYGDDARRQFTRGGKDYIPFREEWQKLEPLIEQAEQRIFRIAQSGEDIGPDRPDPEMLHADGNANIPNELKAFTTSEGLQVNLFASEIEGLTSPLNLRWDPRGRMYVTVTTTYPHVFPGDQPNDKIIVLEDADGDGRADRSTIFAEGLNIPTGIEWGDGGVYVGQNTEILFLRDTDGDGKADQRRVVLGGFGNGDSHQTINSFIWSPGGELFFGQGDGIESRVETPWGASNLYQAGFYRFRPRRLQLHPLLDDFMGPGNPWGVAFDAWGQIFSVDGAGGVTYLSPGQVPTTHRLRLRTIGQPGGYCGIGYLDGRHLPLSLRGDFVVGDFKSNRVKRFSVEDEGAGFSLRWKEPVLRSSHRNFRPVDVKNGPDGAIYIVDWYNPITCHQDDAYRDPRRDKAHGRIWRLSSQSPPVKPPALVDVPVQQVLNGLLAPEHWTRYQAKRALATRDNETVANALNIWVRSLDPNDPRYEHHLYEALGTYATIEVVDPRLLRRLLQAKDPRARAYAARITGRWHDRLHRPLDLLAQRITDEHPRVRMEAVIACAAIPTADSVQIAAHVVDQPMDEWIDYAFKQTVHHLKRHWLPAFQHGELSFAQPGHVAAVLNKIGDKKVVGSLKTLIASRQLDSESMVSAIAAILAVGGPQDLRTFGLDRAQFMRSGRYQATDHAQALAKLVEVARFRDVRPDGDLGASLAPLIDHEHAAIRSQALTLAGIWKLSSLQDSVMAVATNNALPVSVRAAAFQAIADMDLPKGRPTLIAYSTEPESHNVRMASIQALASIDVALAAGHAARMFCASECSQQDAASLLVAFLNRTGGAHALAAALRSNQLSADKAKFLVHALFSTGRSDEALFGVLSDAVGASDPAPEFSNSYVTQIVRDADLHGRARQGALLFKSLACSACHKVGGIGGDVGPDLTAIGTTLSAERIVEELLWPNRQVKEGFSVVQVITEQGKIYQGYERETKLSRDAGALIIQELVTKKMLTIEKQSIEEIRHTGSPMPAGLTALLTRSQLLDLVKHLSQLGGLP